MAWVKQAPVEPGHYWWKKANQKPVVLEIIKRVKTSLNPLVLTTIPEGYHWLLAPYRANPDDLNGGEWWEEPLTPPAYERADDEK